MSSLNNSPSATGREPSAAMAAQTLRERIGQENVTQSSVLASRRLDEALLRLEQASVGKRVMPSRFERAPEPATPRTSPERPTAGAEPMSTEPMSKKRFNTANHDSTLLAREMPYSEMPYSEMPASEMSSDAIESLFGQPIDVMILSTKTKISGAHVLKPHVSPQPETAPRSIPQPVNAIERERPLPTIAPAPASSPTLASAPVTPTRRHAAPRRESRREFVAAWQVDEFIVPSTIDQLFLADSMAEQLAATLAETRTDGLQTIAVTSAKPGEGRSTVAMGLALSIAFSGLRVALVDADRTGVKIATDLQLDLDLSWAEAIRRHVPLEEVAVVSHADSLTLLPLLDRDGGTQFQPSELNTMLVRLRESFDMIVVDCGASAIEEIVLCGAVLIVHDVQRTGTEEVEALSRSLRHGGARGIGVIENFCV